MASRPPKSDRRGTAAEAVDRLVLAIVNAPYKRTIDAETLAARLAKADPGDWSVHVATFFTEGRPDLVFAFADARGLSKSKLADAYFITHGYDPAEGRISTSKTATGARVDSPGNAVERQRGDRMTGECLAPAEAA